MFIILSYDVEKKRNSKVRKVIKKYLRPVHESVFDGLITEGKLNKLKNDIGQIINCDKDSVIIYRIPSEKFATSDEIGISNSNQSQII